MRGINYYIVDVFAENKYEGNQLAVFCDFDDCLSETAMQQIAREINFAETTFIKSNTQNQQFAVRIFTPEHEVPFAGHPSLGTSFVISKFILPTPVPKLTLELAHAAIDIVIDEPTNLDNCIIYMHQAQPEFRDIFSPEEIAEGLGIPLDDIETSLPIQEISTGLPYILIPLRRLASINTLMITVHALRAFLVSKRKYKTNSATGHSTSLFFFTTETYETTSDYNARMLLIENDILIEDAATGSANGCLLAYLLTYKQAELNALVEQGFQMGRKSYIYLDGKVEATGFQLRVGGRNKLIAEGIWHV